MSSDSSQSPQHVERSNNNSTFFNYQYNGQCELKKNKTAQKNINFLTNLLVKPINGHQNPEISDHYNLDISSFAQYTPPISQTGLSILASSKLLKNNSVSSDSTSSLSPTTLSEQSTTTSPVASSPNYIPVNTSPKNDINKNSIFSPILESPDNNQQRSEIVYTPDSLESSNSTSSSLSNLLDEETASKLYVTKSKPLEIEDDLEADEEIRQINDHKSLLEKQSQKNEQLNDTSLILEKIKKINQLQEKINDINNKIKSIDMTSNTVIGDTTNKVNDSTSAINKNYYVLQQSLSDSDSPDLAESPPIKENDSLQYYINPNYCDDDEHSDDEFKRKENVFEDDDDENYNENYQNNLNRFNKCVDRNSEDYRSQNNQTRFGVRQKTVDEKNNEIFENITYNIYKNSTEVSEENDLQYIVKKNRQIDFIDEKHFDDDDDDYDGVNVDNEDDYFDDDDDEDEDLFHNGSYIINGNFKQAQPVHKKFASTGFLCHRFGGYLAPIEESQDEPPLQLEKGSNIIKNSTSCYNLVRDNNNFKSMNENIETNHLTNNESTNTNNRFHGPVLSYSQASVNYNASSNEFSSHIIKNECINFNRLTPVLDNDFLNEPVESLLAIEMNEAKLIMDTPEEDPVENKYDESSMSNEDEAEEAASNSHLQDESIPEDNVERLRNIRDMFENSNETDDQMLLHKMERVQPSEKLMKRVSNEMHDFEFNDLENLEIKTSEHQNPEQKAYSLSDESLNDNNTEEDVEETDNYCYQEKANPEKAEDSIVAKIENSLLQGNQNKEAQRSINGDNLEMCDNQSSATSSVSSSTSITSTTPDEIINDEKIIETETDSEIKDKLHAVSISNFEVNENNEVCFENENRFQDGSCEDYEDYEDNEENEIEEVIYDDQHEEVDLKAKRYARKKEKILPFADMNNVMSKFENMNCNSDDRSGPKPPRHITPPRLKALYEICNTPAERAEGVVGANDKIDDVKPQEGFIRNRRQQFTSPSSPNSNENKSHLINDIAPGSTKNAAAMFANSANESNDRWANRLKNIENSGITIEGEVVEKGLAQSRLAMFNDEPQTTFHTPTVTEQDSEILQSAAGIAKDRMNIFKNLETKGDKPREFKKLKEFTPPPTLDGQPRQYIIIDKESSPSESADRHESYNREEFIPEAGLAKNRMKQFLENSQNQDIHSHNNTEEVIGKGYAKSLLAKWKSMESMEGKEGSPTRRLSKEGSPGSVDVLNGDQLIQQGHAKSLLNKWNNIDSNSEQPRRAPRQITPPPSDDVQRNKQMFDSPQEQHLSKTVDTDAELNLIRRGNARNALAKYESNPTESMINAQFCEEEVIPSAGHAKSLKDKFLNLEKEKSKVETSSSKMNYVPKKFTSSAAPQSNVSNTPKQAPQVKKIEASRIANVAAGPEKPKDNSAKENNINAYLNHHTSTLHGGEKCCVCDKTVYAMEKTEADKKVYHKLCFKCTTCNCTLNEESFGIENGFPFCIRHLAKQPVSPQKSPMKQRMMSQNESMESLHIDTTCSFDSDSMKSPTGSVKSPVKSAKASPKSAALSPKSAAASPRKN